MNRKDEYLRMYVENWAVAFAGINGFRPLTTDDLQTFAADLIAEYEEQKIK